ncbi:hypothetical protein [Micromonospora chersina]|uniref:hypothetical protein n=1 Tax=Micromonospora chersina TaxID=47854 RepID=UPI0037121D9F
MDTTRSTIGAVAGGGMGDAGASRMRLQAVGSSGQRRVRRSCPGVVDDVQEDPVEPDLDPLTGKWHADADLPAADADPAAGVDDPVDLDGGGLRLRLRQRRGPGGCTALGQDLGQMSDSG